MTILEALKMRDILTKTQLRRLKLIEMFFSHSNWIDIKGLTSELKQSERTIHDDMLIINNDYPYIEFTRVNKHYRMKISPHYDIQLVYQNLLTDNLILNVIEDLLYQPINTLEELSEKYFVSSPTLYRKIRNINPILKKSYNIEISSIPYELSGLETDIRSFYAQLISEKYPVQVWPFKNIDEKKLQDFIFYFTNLLGIPLDFASMRFVKTITAINILRLTQGHYIKNLKPDTPGLFNKIQHSEEFRKQKNYIKIYFNLSLDEEMLNQIFAAFSQETFLYSFDDLMQKESENPYIKKSIEHLHNMLKSISQDFDVPIPNYEQLLLDMHNTSQLEKQEIYTNFILYDRKDDFSHKLSTLYPNFFNRVKTEIINYRKVMGHNENSIMINHLVYTLFTHWKHLSVELEKKRQKTYVLVISDYDARHVNMLVDTLNYLTNDQVIVEALTELKIDLEAIEASKYDIIVSNFYLENNQNLPHVYIKGIPTEDDLEALNHLIVQISRQRAQN